MRLVQYSIVILIATAFFFEVQKDPSIRGRAVLYDQILDGCPVTFENSSPFDIPAYKGPKRRVSKKN